MASKHPRFDHLTTRQLYRAADQYNRLSGMFEGKNYQRYYFQCVGELISRGLWSRFEQWISRRARK